VAKGKFSSRNAGRPAHSPFIIIPSVTTATKGYTSTSNGSLAFLAKQEAKYKFQAVSILFLHSTKLWLKSCRCFSKI
jgi:hypothetical protein